MTSSMLRRGCSVTLRYELMQQTGSIRRDTSPDLGLIAERLVAPGKTSVVLHQERLSRKPHGITIRKAG